MARKFIEKLIIVMIYFVIFIIMKVHGNDIVPTYFHPFSLSPPLPDHPSQIDKVKSIFHICIEKHMETCEKMSKEEDIALRTLCFMKCFPDCIAEYPDQDYPMYHMAKRG